MIFIITIVLDGLKFLPIQLATFNKLTTPWRWICVEGQAANVNCTAWTAKMPPRLSIDGSTHWLAEVSKYHPNVTHIPQTLWEGGKLEMFNAAMAKIHALAGELGVKDATVMEIDADEQWTPSQLELIAGFFRTSSDYQRMQFKCQYHVGPNLVITTENTYGNNLEYEWFRAWRYFPQFRFLRHEAPVVNSPEGKTLDCHTTERMGLKFCHQSYFYESQAEYKMRFYQYPDALNQWRALQAAPKPCRVGDYLKWVTDGAMCDNIFK